MSKRGAQGGGSWASRFRGQIADTVVSVAAPPEGADAVAAPPKGADAVAAADTAPVEGKQFANREPRSAFRAAFEEKAALLGHTRSKGAARKQLMGAE